MAVKAHHLHLLRKRSEDMATNYTPINTNAFSRKRPRDVLCELNSAQINQEMLEINHILSQHMEKVRIAMTEMARRQINHISVVIGNEISQKLKRKDGEMERIAEANRALEERINHLAMEVQLWRNLAQSNEVAANMLRSNLEVVLSNRREEKAVQCLEEAESICSGGEEEDRDIRRRARVCRYCHEKVASMLLLPCRHLCLCDSCGNDPTVVICPACGADPTGVLKVNLD